MTHASTGTGAGRSITTGQVTRLVGVLYFLGFAVFTLVLRAAIDRRHRELAIAVKWPGPWSLWLLLPFVVVWPLGILRWRWLIDRWLSAEARSRT